MVKRCRQIFFTKFFKDLDKAYKNFLVERVIQSLNLRKIIENHTEPNYANNNIEFLDKWIKIKLGKTKNKR